MLVETLGALSRHFSCSIGQDNDEFIATIAAGNVLPSDVLPKQAGHFSQDRIPRCMAPGVVESLEIIHIQHDDAQ